MIGTTLVEFVFIRITIVLLRLVAPFSLIYLAEESWRGTFSFASPFIIYALLEFGFFALVYLPRERLLQKVGTPTITRTSFVTLDRCSPPNTRCSRENSARSS